MEQSDEQKKELLKNQLYWYFETQVGGLKSKYNNYMRIFNGLKNIQIKDIENITLAIECKNE